MKLHIYRRDTLEHTLELTGRDLRIGRGVENDIVLEDAEQSVSRFHAELRQEGDEYVLVDLHSQHGTWVDGQRMHETASVSPGMTIAVGQFRLVLDDAAGYGTVSGHEGTRAGLISDDSPLPGVRGAASAAAAAGVSSGASHSTAASASAAASAGRSASAAGARASKGASGAASRGAGAATGKTAGAASRPTASTTLFGLPRVVVYGASVAILTLAIGIPSLLRTADSHPTRDAVRADQPAAGAPRPGGTAANAAYDEAGASHKPGGNVGKADPGPDAASAATAPPAPAAAAPKSTSTRAAAAANASRLAQANAAVANQYAQAKTALATGQYREAIAALEGVLRERPAYLDAAALLEQANAGLRGEAQRVAAQAAGLADRGDFTGALREYERASRLDPALTAASTGVTDVRARMKAAGDDAYRRGRQFEAVGRVHDATTQYSRAAELLSAEDTNGKAARERLEALTRQP